MFIAAILFFVRKKEHVERGSLLGNIAKREYNSL